MSDWHSRYRRIIDAYREALRAVDPYECRLVDGKMESWGESWVCDDDLPDMDALMSAAAIARKWGFQRWDIANWVRAGGIMSPKSSNGIPLYRVGDVLAHFARKNAK